MPESVTYEIRPRNASSRKGGGGEVSGRMGMAREKSRGWKGGRCPVEGERAKRQRAGNLHHRRATALREGLALTTTRDAPTTRKSCKVQDAGKSIEKDTNIARIAVGLGHYRKLMEVNWGARRRDMNIGVSADRVGLAFIHWLGAGSFR